MYFFKKQNIFNFFSKKREYLKFYWGESTKYQDINEKKIISELNQRLRNELMIEANKMILKESEIFSQNFS